MGGLRPALANKGITLSLEYLQYVLGDPVGKQRKAVHSEMLGLDLNWDFGHGFGVEGFSFHLDMFLTSGQNLDPKIGNAFPITPVYGGRTLLISNLYFQQTACRGNLLVKAGRIQAGDDFLTSPLIAKFMNQAFSFQMPFYINTPTSGPPYAAWGAFIQLPLLPNLRLKLGAYGADRLAYQNKYHGLDLSWDQTEGAQLVEELSYLWNVSQRLPGIAKLGTFYTTGTTFRYISSKSHGNFGTYLLLEQGLLKSEEGCKLSVFATSLFFPKDRNIFPYFFSTGLVGHGIFPSRRMDTTCLGFARGSYSSVLRALQQQAKNQGLPGTYGNIPQNFEAAVELNHEFYITPWAKITPAFEYIFKPGGSEMDAVVLLLQTKLDF